MEKKRIIFGVDERAKVRQLVIERKDIVECKKSDLVTVGRKKQAWEEITQIFNSDGSFPKRNTVQLKEMWDNTKARRKAQLSQEKREVMRTGGGSQNVVIPEDPELDSLGVNIELWDEAMDSDTLLTGSSAYVIVGDVMEPALNDNVEISMTVNDSPSLTRQGEIAGESPNMDNGILLNSPVTQQSADEPSSFQRRNLKKGSKFTSWDDLASRVRRNEQFAIQDMELHSFRLSELQKRNDLLERQILHEEEIFYMKKENLELKKRKLLLEIQRLEGED